MATYDELDHELIDTELSSYRDDSSSRSSSDIDDGWNWDSGDAALEEEHIQRLRDITDRPDSDVRKDVQRMLILDCLVPMTVDVEVRDGIVTLAGTVGNERERECAKYLTGLVPGVFGVDDQLAVAEVETAPAEAMRECTDLAA
jgi:hypothetical protein